MAKTKSEMWFEENVSENQKELLEIGELANAELYKKISLGLGNPMTTIAIYAKIFECICDEIASKEAEWADFNLNIADRFRIGYTTTNNEDDEKMGNFMIFMENIDHIYAATDDDDLDADRTTVELCSDWNAANVKVQSDVIKQISAKSKNALSELINMKLESHEFIIPMFCIIHEQIINYIKLKKVEEKKDYELNVAGLYTIGIQDVEKEIDGSDGVTNDIEEDIYFIPSISLKLRFKSDQIATGKDE